MTEASRAYLLWGDDQVTRDEAVRSLRTRLLARPAGPLNLTELHAPDLDAAELIATCDTLPFLDDRRLVIVHGLYGWRPRGPARTRGADTERPAGRDPLSRARDAFSEYLPRLAPQTTLVLVEGELAPAQRSAIQGCLPPGRAEVRAFLVPQGAALDQWLTRRAARRGGSFEPGAAAFLREHGPGSVEALDQEVAKLVAYAGGQPISIGDVGELVAAAETVVFALLDAVAEGKPRLALEALRQLQRQGQRVEEIVPQVIALIRRLLVCRLALTERMSASEVTRLHGVRLIDKLRMQARSWTVDRSVNSLELLISFDRRLKRGEVEPEAGLELLIMSLAATAEVSPVARR